MTGTSEGNHVAGGPPPEAQDPEKLLTIGTCASCLKEKWVNWQEYCEECDPGPCHCGNFRQAGEILCISCIHDDGVLLIKCPTCKKEAPHVYQTGLLYKCSECNEIHDISELIGGAENWRYS